MPQLGRSSCSILEETRGLWEHQQLLWANLLPTGEVGLLSTSSIEKTVASVSRLCTVYLERCRGASSDKGLLSLLTPTLSLRQDPLRTHGLSSFLLQFQIRTFVTWPESNLTTTC